MCGAASGAAPICHACYLDLPVAPQACCPRCALAAGDGALCGRCLASPPAYDASYAPFAYAFPLDQLLLRLKFGGALGLAPWFAAHMAAVAPARVADCVVVVPSGRQRLRERGYNQALELAKPLARRLRLPLLRHAIARRGEGVPQSRLPYKERRRNVRGVFQVVAELTGRRVLVIDDVMTTGATLDELALQLKAAGAIAVTNLVAARTPSSAHRGADWLSATGPSVPGRIRPDPH